MTCNYCAAESCTYANGCKGCRLREIARTPDVLLNPGKWTEAQARAVKAERRRLNRLGER